MHTHGARRRCCLVSLGLAWLETAAFADPAADPGTGDPGRHLAMQTWSVRDGLPQSSVTGLHQTSDGRLWIGSFGGFAVFDGVQFTTFNQATHPELPTIRVTGLTGDAQDHLWLGLQDNGIVRFDGARVSKVPMDPEVANATVTTIAITRDGAVWAAAAGHAIVFREGAFHADPDAQATLGTIRATWVDRQGAVWFAGVDGAACWDGPCAQPRERGATTDALLSWDYESVPPDPRNGLGPGREEGWFARVHWGSERWRGVSRLDDRRRDGFPQLRSALVDREGTLWVGSIGGSLTAVRDLGVTHFDVDRGASVQQLGSTPDGVIVRTADALWRQTAGGFTRVPIRPRIGHLHVDAAGQAWVTADHRVLRLNGDQLEPFPIGDADAAQTTALTWIPRPSGPGELWLATPAGVARVVDGAVTGRWDEAAVGPRVVVIRSGPDGATWIGGEHGLARVSPNGELQRWTPAEGLSAGQVRDLWWAPDGALWAGTYGGGLSRLKDGAIQRLTTDDGLCEAVASRILADDQGQLWINGNRGLSRLSLREMEARLAGGPPVHCNLYETGEGNFNHGIREPSGVMWFPTLDGVTRVDPTTLPNTPPPPLRIGEVLVDDAPLPRNGEAPPGFGLVTLQYSAVALANAPAVRYRYRLHGYDRAWVDAQSARYARYTSLPPGPYRFEVQARFANGAWGPGQSVTFRLAPHFYQMRTFQALGVLAAVALGGLLSRARARLAETQNRALHRQIAERERVEAALREREAHYRTVFRQASNGLFIHDLSGSLLEVNPAGLAMIADHPSGDPLFYVAPASRPEVDAAVRAASNGQTIRGLEVSLLGETGPVEVLLSAGPLGEGDARRVLVSAVDLRAERRAERERRQLEQQLQHSQRLEALGQFAAGIAHDFNNVLTVIGLHATLLSERAETSAAGELGAIDAAVQRAQALTRKLLAFGKAHPPSLITTPLPDAIAGTIAMVRSVLPAPIRLTVAHTASSPLLVEVDPIRLEQVLMNLVINARDAVGSRGSILVQTGRVNVDEATARAHSLPAGPYAFLDVLDDGAGIPAEHLDRVFEAFFTTKEAGKGTGLGLSTVERAVRESHGFVTVESVFGRGTRFRVHLPLTQGVPPAAELVSGG